MCSVQIVLLCKYGNGIIGKHPGIEGAGGKMVVGIIPVHIIHHAYIDIVGGDNDDDGVGADADLEIVVVHVWGAVSG